MGRKERWYSRIKKVLTPGSKPRIKSKKPGSESGSKRFGKHSQLNQPAPVEQPVAAVHPLPQVAPVRFIEASSESGGAQLSEKAAALAPKIALGIMQHIGPVQTRYVAESEVDIAAIQIQTAYRGYLARRTLRALRGVIGLRFLAQGQAVKRQAANTLQCMQALARVQSQACSRRVQSWNRNQDLQKQRMRRGAKKHTAFRNSEDWKDCVQSKQQDEAKMKKKHEAAIRRERTLAYSSVHQQTWKNSPKRTSNTATINPDSDNDDPSWGWSWLERWMAAAKDEGLDSAVPQRRDVAEVEAATEPQATLLKSPPNIKTAPRSPPNAKVAENPKSARAPARPSNGSGSENTEKNRRHSFAGSSSTRECVTSAGSPSNSPRTHPVPSRFPNTRPRLQSPLGVDHSETGTPPRKSSTARQADKPPSHPAPHNNPRRHSAPPKVRNSNQARQNQNSSVQIC
uniref:Uncharacterized protein n=1 Tax=Kalanchoe fedtschenkoi TaxID=63787 RepID=A0A7N1A8X2_KALFE